MTIYSKQELASYLKEHGIYLSKKLGQNFLLDKNVINKLIQAAEIKNDDFVMEIGGGLGHLTSQIIETNADVVVFEIDKKLAQLLAEKFRDNPRVNLIWEDFLKANLEKVLPKEKKIKILANLPYYITSPILEKCFQYASQIDSMIFTVQKEFAHRIIAKPGKKDYGSLSVFCQVYSQPKLLFQISKNVFFPVPKVDSSVIYLKPKSKIDVHNKSLFFNILKSIYSSRRKTIFNSLSKNPFIDLKKEVIADSLKELSINPLSRGEELSPYMICKLTNNIDQNI